MLGAVLLTVLLQLAVIYVPALNIILHTQPLPLADLAACIALCLACCSRSRPRNGWCAVATSTRAAGCP